MGHGRVYVWERTRAAASLLGCWLVGVDGFGGPRHGGAVRPRVEEALLVVLDEVANLCYLLFTKGGRFRLCGGEGVACARMDLGGDECECL